MLKLMSKAFVGALLLGFAATASAATIFIADDQGNVAVYDDVLDSLAVVGDLAGFTINQNIGIAYDPTTGGILLLDRSAPAVYTMDPATGAASLLFTPSQEFQGGAVKGNLLYGIDEGAQALVAYDLTTFNPVALSGTSIPGHTHALGIDTASGQLLSTNAQLGVFVINDDGTIGATRVAGGAQSEDMDPLGADYLAVYYGDSVELIDGTTGASSILLDGVRTASVGLNSNISGVVVAGGAAVGPPPLQAQAIPSMSQWGMALLMIAMFLVVYSRRKLMNQ